MGFYDVLQERLALGSFRNQFAHILSSKSLEQTDQFGADLACYSRHDWYEWYQVMEQCVLHVARQESSVEPKRLHVLVYYFTPCGDG